MNLCYFERRAQLLQLVMRFFDPIARLTSVIRGEVSLLTQWHAYSEQRTVQHMKSQVKHLF